MSTDTIRYDKDGDGIVTLTLDDPNQSANTMNADFVDSYEKVAKQLEDEKDDIAGIIITSAKSTFFAGGDLRDLIKATPEDADDVAAQSNRIKAAMRTIETLGKPVVAAINGSALGGGLEIALACHHRIAIDNPKTLIGLPEVTLGLLPGGGGCVRVPRMLGIMNGLLNVLVQGQQMKVAKAKDVGVIDAVVADEDTMLADARAWIAEHPESAQPWDQKGYRMPGGAPSHPMFAQNSPALAANLKKQMKGAHYDAPHHIMAAVYEGAQVDVDNAMQIETRYFVDLVCNSPAVQEHDAGVLLRPAGHQQGQVPPRRLRPVEGDEGRRAGRRHDGRGHRLPVRQVRHRGRPQGHLDRERREGQGLLAHAGREGRQQGQGHPGEG